MQKLTSPFRLTTMATLTGTDAARLLLKKLGMADPHRWPQQHGGPAIEGIEMVNLLGRSGLRATLRSLPFRDLRFLPLPALLEVKSGRWLLIVGISRSRLEIETDLGLESLLIQELADPQSMDIVNVEVPNAPDCTMWTRVQESIPKMRNFLILVGGSTLLMLGAAMAAPVLTGVLVNQAIPNDAPNTVNLIAITLLSAAVLRAWLGWLRDRTLSFALTRLELRGETEYIYHVLSFSLQRLQATRFADLLQGFLGYSIARETMNERVLSIAFDSVLLIGYLVAMAALLPSATFVILGVLAILCVSSSIAARSQAQLQEVEIGAELEIKSFLSEAISGIETVKVFSAEQMIFAGWNERLKRRFRAGLRKGRISLLSDLMVGVASQAITVGTLIYLGEHAINGEIRVGTLMEYLQLTAGLTSATTSLLAVQNAWTIVEPQIRKASVLLGAKSPHLLLAPTVPTGSIVLPARLIATDVWFRYSHDTPWILSRQNFAVEPGQHIFLQGPSGVGKSTLLRVLAGLQRPSRGKVEIRNELSSVQAPKVRYLPQTIKLFGGSVLDNLYILSGGASYEEVVTAASLTGLTEMLGSLPMGLQTILTPGGGSLSGGQRQLIALTAIMASRCSLLLLDEAMSNLDNISSARVRQALKQLRTTVVESSHGSHQSGDNLVLQSLAADVAL